MTTTNDDVTTGELKSVAVNTDEVEELLLGEWSDTRRASRELMKDSQFHKIEGLSMEDARERTLKQLHGLVENNSVHRADRKSVV